jgi:hypothetical protein
MGEVEGKGPRGCVYIGVLVGRARIAGLNEQQRNEGGLGDELESCISNAAACIPFGLAKDEREYSMNYERCRVYSSVMDMLSRTVYCMIPRRRTEKQRIQNQKSSQQWSEQVSISSQSSTKIQGH